MSIPIETLIPAFSDSEQPLVSYGLPFVEACHKHVEETFHASKIYIIASASLARNTSDLSNLQSSLGNKVVGTRIGMKAHTYISEVLEIVREVQSTQADLIVTLGGGSLSDAAKIISMAVANDRTTPEALKQLPHGTDLDRSANPAKIPVICIPTTLSGGEYSAWAGVTDDGTGLKYQFGKPLKAPALIILDGTLACTMPLHSWLESGIRAVDHCVEALCSLENGSESGKRVPEADEACVEGLRQLVPGLLRCKKNPEDAAARHACQLGVMKSMVPLHFGVWAGASHGIGHMLGPLGVAHGATSCILTPSVAKWNAAHFDQYVPSAKSYGLERQEIVRSTLCSIPESKVLFSRGLSEITADLGDLLDALISELGMPRHLKEVGIGEDRFDEIAKNSIQDFFLQTNPVPMKEGMEEQVKEVLRMCA